MLILTGTSGFSYPTWRGTFYPDKLPAADMLSFYAGQLAAVEINNTFYKMPEAPVLKRWAAEVPPAFRFALKSPRAITHMWKLKNAAPAVRRLAKRVGALGNRLGPILFQLPPVMQKDTGRLDAFLAALPDGLRATVEFRHDSWLADDTYAVLEKHAAALCVADSEELQTGFEATADWGYLRLRREHYDRAALRRWAKRLQAQRFDTAYVFFKHEVAGPALAQDLRGMMI
jgi:uncharacterized protein YecE (DUF72 family)